jgi:PEP-CTERM motif
MSEAGTSGGKLTMRKSTTALAVILAFGSLAAAHASVTFTTFVPSGSIFGVEGQNNTIGFTYAGNKFVGSVYFGPNNGQLYQTNLVGGGVMLFGSAMPGASGETVLGSSLGQAGFAKGDIYASPANNIIYHYANSGGAPTVFGSVPAGQVIRQVFFDPGTTFGGDMIVSTNAGNIYRFNSAGVPTLVASVGTDTEGLDIASSKFGPYSGQLLVTSEGTGLVHAISPGGTISTLPMTGGGAVAISLAETVSTVPLNLGSSGKAIEGFYVANYPSDIQFAAASQFAGLQGDAIVTSEFGSNSTIWDLHWNGSSFDVSSIGALPLQSEDGIFVTAQRIQEQNAPEPITLSLFGAGLAGAFFLRRRKPV